MSQEDKAKSICTDCFFFVDPQDDEEEYPCQFAEELNNFVERFRGKGYDVEFAVTVVQCPNRIIIRLIDEEKFDAQEKGKAN